MIENERSFLPSNQKLLRVVIEEIKPSVWWVYAEVQSLWVFGIKTKAKYYVMHSTPDGFNWNTKFIRYNDALEAAKEVETTWEKLL